MKTLYVARHATAQIESATGKDFDRRLAQRGELEIAAIAARTQQLERGLDLIVASPAARTVATAAAYARVFGLGQDRCMTNPTIYSNDDGHLLELIQSLPDTADRVLVVGHNPVISAVARWLANTDDFPEFVPAAIAVYELEIDTWAHVDPTLVRLVARLAPTD
ncbi:MAG: histidine phosphatase family protein [Pseudomonadota bacterium]|jgi:phosphohistidine phosphatase